MQSFQFIFSRGCCSWWLLPILNAPFLLRVMLWENLTIRPLPQSFSWTLFVLFIVYINLSLNFSDLHRRNGFNHSLVLLFCDWSCSRGCSLLLTSARFSSPVEITWQHHVATRVISSTSCSMPSIIQASGRTTLVRTDEGPKSHFGLALFVMCCVNPPFGMYHLFLLSSSVIHAAPLKLQVRGGPDRSTLEIRHGKEWDSWNWRLVFYCVSYHASARQLFPFQAGDSLIDASKCLISRLRCCEDFYGESSPWNSTASKCSFCEDVSLTSS